MKARIYLMGMLTIILMSGGAWAAERRYVGSEACSSCHADEYKSFCTYAKKSHSFASVEKLKRGLTPAELNGCYGCHTTGYGKPGGFESLEKTPELKNAGCEVCHGPGSVHAQSGNRSDIDRKPDRRLCESCHTSSRVQAFNYKPVMHGGAH